MVSVFYSSYYRDFLLKYFSLSLVVDHIKRKFRRRPAWVRGIIRKKKIHKKETEEEEEEQEAEAEAAGPSDSCLTQDEESSCDTMGPQPNGHHPNVLSTEEESSNEPLVTAPKPLEAKEEEPIDVEAQSMSVDEHPLHCQDDDSQSKVDGDGQEKQADFQPLAETSESSDAEAQPKHTQDLLVPQVDCVNGNESMDSVDSQSPKTSSEAEKAAEACDDHPEREEHKDKSESQQTQEQPPQDETAGTEHVEDDQDKEGL